MILHCEDLVRRVSIVLILVLILILVQNFKPLVDQVYVISVRELE